MADWEQAAIDELARLGKPHLDKKRATIIALVDANLAGRPEETVWNQPGTCSRNTYHTKWKHDDTFASVLVNVKALAREWRDTEAVRALAEAARRLALASPVAVAVAIAAMKADDEATRLRAAFGILDRAGVETATKATTQVDAHLTMEELSDEELAKIAAG